MNNTTSVTTNRNGFHTMKILETPKLDKIINSTIKKIVNANPASKSKTQPQYSQICKSSGFTLVELMVVIAIIAILGAVAVPAYQRYIQKASMTDMLQNLTTYKTSVELCALQQSLNDCNSGQFGIPLSNSTRYVSSASVNNGVIELIGQQALQSLTLRISPQTNTQTGSLEWTRECNSDNQTLKEACEEVISF